MNIAVIGDIHGFWDSHDTAFFNASTYDALLFVGDLPRWTGTRAIAREIGRVTKPAWLIPGNHDGCTKRQLLAEMGGSPLLCYLTSLGMQRRVAAMRVALGAVRMAGYECFELEHDLGLIVARPHAMGPDRFYYRHYMRSAHAVSNYAESADKLKSIVDKSPKRLIFLAHNGPSGLGDQPHDIWGCDFAPEKGDFGDPDLRAAVDHAKHTGHQVLAVVAGHMHLYNPDRQMTRTRHVDDGTTLYVNAAEVARIRKQDSRRHHVALAIENDSIRAETVFVDAAGHELERIPMRR